MFKFETILALVEKHVRDHDVQYVTKYGEPGYTDPARGILFANWNDTPRWLMDGLERRGFELEWSDEWIQDYDNDKAYRTSPDSHGWKPSFVLTEGGDVVGRDEAREDVESYVQDFLLNNNRRADTFDVDLASIGFEKFNDDYETGFHPGQNDDPKKVFAKIKADRPGYDVVFKIDSVGQFDTSWTAWIRKSDTD